MLLQQQAARLCRDSDLLLEDNYTEDDTGGGRREEGERTNLTLICHRSTAELTLVACGICAFGPRSDGLVKVLFSLFTPNHMFPSSALSG